MEEKCQVNDDSSAKNQICQRLATSVVENKTSMQLQGDVCISTISTEKVQSSNQTSISSDLSSETGQELIKDQKDLVAKRIKINKRNSIIGVLKSESLFPEESSERARPNSFDFDAKRLRQSLNENSAENSQIKQDRIGYFHTTSSYDSKNVHKSDVASSDHNPQMCKINLCEGVKTYGDKFLQRSNHKSNSSGHPIDVLEPISVVAKVGVPIGQPRKPLQFGGERGWRRLGTTSAFRPFFLRNSERRNKIDDNSKICGSRQSLFSQGIDLNVAPVMDFDHPTDDTAMDVSSNQPQRCLLGLNSESGNDVNHHKPENHVIRDTYKTTNQKLTQIHVAVDSPTCSRGSERKPIFESRRSPYWVDSNSMPGFDHGQPRPLLVAMPPAEQVQMVVPIQSEVSFFPHAPSGVYIGKINGPPPTFHHGFLSHLNGHHGPVLTSYPRTLNVIESSQRLNPNTLANIRPTFIQNSNIAFLGNGSSGARQIEQLALPDFSPKRREPDGGWDSSPISYRRIAP